MQINLYFDISLISLSMDIASLFLKMLLLIFLLECSSLTILINLFLIWILNFYLTKIDIEG